MLAFPNWEETFVIEADASTRAVAAVLSQRNKHTGQLHPIDFFSSALSSAQRNYSAGQLEAWALVAACRKWRTYLGARGEVELITDHCPLKWLRSQKDPRRTYARWILELEEYSYNIIHRPGRENNLPDYLSRIPTIEIDAEVQNECTFEDKIFTVVSQHEEEPKLNLAQIRMEQERDPITRNAREQLRFKRIVTSGKFRHVAEHLGLSDGVLLFQNRIMVPGDSRDDVLVRVHAAGHFGQKRTLQNLRRNYFWLGMARDARRFCQRCRTCQKAKALNRAKVPIQEFKAEGLGPGDLVAMDIATLPWADEKYRYFLCIVDIFTRYIELCPMRDQSAASVVREFERGWIFRGHGVPRGLLTDQAHNIDGVEVRRMCDKLGIEKRHSSPYHPQGDGMVERSIGLVKQVARCLTLDRNLPKESWPDILPEVAFYCNNTENVSTGYSAQLLMTGRQPLSPMEIAISKEWTDERDYNEHVEKLKERVAELKRLAGGNDQQSRTTRNDRRNEGAKLPQIAKGDLVLVRNEKSKDSLDPKYIGPYRVMEAKDANIKIKRKRNTKWIHVSRCKLSEKWQSQVTTSVAKQGTIIPTREEVVDTESREAEPNTMNRNCQGTRGIETMNRKSVNRRRSRTQSIKILALRIRVDTLCVTVSQRSTKIMF